jgi:RNA polymerase sigma factor (TIGR02999 family)
MSEATRILEAVNHGDVKAAEELLPLVYNELRQLAAHRLAQEGGGQTLQATALVHEAWLRLAGDRGGQWEGRAQFFSAAAEAMRRILIERVRRRKTMKRGCAAEHEALDEAEIALAAPSEQILAVHDAIDRLMAEDALAAELVKLRYFVGMTMPEAAEALGMSQRTVERLWTFARAWLRNEIGVAGG